MATELAFFVSNLVAMVDLELLRSVVVVVGTVAIVVVFLLVVAIVVTLTGTCSWWRFG